MLHVDDLLLLGIRVTNLHLLRMMIEAEDNELCHPPLFMTHCVKCQSRRRSVVPKKDHQQQHGRSLCPANSL